MNEVLPYEKELPNQWDDLPLPDENKAWEDMRRRLEEDDDDKPVVIWWKRGCMLWGLLLLALVAGGWLLFKQNKKENQKNEDETLIVETKRTKNSSTDITITKQANSGDLIINEAIDSDTSSNSIIRLEDSTGQYSGNERNEVKKRNAKNNEVLFVTNTNAKKNKSGKSKIKAAQREYSGNDVLKDAFLNTISNTSQQLDTTANKTQSIVDSAFSVKNDTVSKKVNQAVNLETSVAKTDSSKKGRFFFSAGIGLYQQLPIAGQKFTPYTASGRKASMADYIPSVYFRLTNENKWFLQTGFRYGAPQSTKEFVYNSASRMDTIQGAIFLTTNSTKLKKTFYHQIPLTFNYYVAKNWSIGAGIQLNKFHTAVSERSVVRNSNATGQDSLLSKTIVSDKNDSSFSVFKKTYFLGVLESQYQVKRFSFGLKYSFGLQPYINYTLPNNSPQSEKTQSFQLFIRYQLWRSKE